MNWEQAHKLQAWIACVAPWLTRSHLIAIENGTRYAIKLDRTNFIIWNEQDWEWCYNNPDKGFNSKLLNPHPARSMVA